LIRKEPRYWGTWKAQVILAIVRGARTWRDIRKSVGLLPESLNTALSEMFNDGTLEKRGGVYWIPDDELYQEYRDLAIGIEGYITGYLQSGGHFFSKDFEELLGWLALWREVKGLNLSLECGHFFLKGKYLDAFSKDIIGHAKRECLIVNPYVKKIDLSDTMQEASKRGVTVTLITRRIDQDLQYHKTLMGAGVNVIHNERVHAKLIVVDQLVAVVSSMNFFSGSSAGGTWEAGIVSIEGDVVKEVVKSIRDLLEKSKSR